MRYPVLLGLLLLAAILAGCPPEETQPVNSDLDKPKPAPASDTHIRPPPAPAPEDDVVDSSQFPGRVHVVEPKDTLLQLAEKYYGNRNQWRKIWQANKKRLNDPNNLPVGMKLIIP